MDPINEVIDRCAESELKAIYKWLIKNDFTIRDFIDFDDMYSAYKTYILH